MQLLEWGLVKPNANDSIFISLNYWRTIGLVPLAFYQTLVKRQRNIDIAITLTFLKVSDFSPLHCWEDYRGRLR